MDTVISLLFCNSFDVPAAVRAVLLQPRKITHGMHDSQNNNHFFFNGINNPVAAVYKLPNVFPPFFRPFSALFPPYFRHDAPNKREIRKFPNCVKSALCKFKCVVFGIASIYSFMRSKSDSAFRDHSTCIAL